MSILALGWLLLSTPDCVSVANEARYANYGYDHIVILENRCREVQQCVVTTDSNPRGQTVSVGESQRIEVLMFRGSPARTFTSRVACTAR